ncbi:hypothetical protein SEA_SCOOBYDOOBYDOO_184 [Mycobacterium phage ScoobyDoobyDoo]|nr:hypothetical protein SEA_SCOOBYDOOBYDOO_184 [Mycobacterium phage ScoobyDoobyDoo]
MATFEGLYEIERNGTVWSVGYGTRRALKPWPRGERGHLAVTLYREGKRVTRYVHHLVLEAFVGPCPPGLQRLHKDDDNANNDVSNLYYGTFSENLLDRVRNGRHPGKNKVECVRGHRLEAPNLRPSKKGYRMCLACHRGRENARLRGRDVQQLADEAYERIMRETAT